MMEVYQWFNTTESTSIATWMSAIFVAMTAGVAYHQLKAMNDQTARTTRPMMGASLVSGRYVYEPMRLAINNFGQSVARNVEFEFDPPLPEKNLAQLNERARKKRSNGTYIDIEYHTCPVSFLKKCLEGQEIGTWPPNYKVEFDYFVPQKNADLSESAEGISEKTKLIIRYQDDVGEKYVESFALNPHLLVGINYYSDGTRTD